MAAKSKTQTPKSRGDAFRNAALKGFELTGSEMELLNEVCNFIDEIDELQSTVMRDGITVTGSTGQTRVHPALGELRQHRLALGRLLAQLGLPDPDGASLPTSVQVRGRASARKRWGTDNG